MAFSIETVNKWTTQKKIIMGLLVFIALISFGILPLSFSSELGLGITIGHIIGVLAVISALWIRNR